LKRKRELQPKMPRLLDSKRRLRLLDSQKNKDWPRKPTRPIALKRRPRLLDMLRKKESPRNNV